MGAWKYGMSFFSWLRNVFFSDCWGDLIRHSDKFWAISVFLNIFGKIRKVWNQAKNFQLTRFLTTLTGGENVLTRFRTFTIEKNVQDYSTWENNLGLEKILIPYFS